ncbi:MAG: hypothetical protein IJ634_08340 [Bacteroidales bacterium]|nr:hypothetical protein [Bacteroidales bacterium]
MKKIALIAMALLLTQGALMAQKKVAEKDVKVSYVKDFQRQVKDPTNVEWYQIDENTFKVTYRDFEKSPQAMVFSNKGMETHYIIEDHYPQSITSYIKDNYPKHSIDLLWVRKARNKMTYQARIVQKKGFLWWKKVKDVKVLNFEVDGKFISAE